MLKKILTITAMAVITLGFAKPLSCAAKTHAYPEKFYQEQWCGRNNGVLEYTLPDKTRVDCLTETHAIEFDFAKKWAESVGQSLYYAMITGKTPGIVLILEKESDSKYYERIKKITDKYGITLFTMTAKS